MLRIGSLCTGYGGLDLAAEAVLGPMNHLWHAEFDPALTAAGKPVPQYAAQVCAAHWPDVPNLGDLTAIDFAGLPAVDVLTAGFPCTDVSPAGKRAGLKPGTRTGIWSNIASAIGILRPRLVLLENVEGLLSARAHSDVEPCPWCLGDTDPELVVRALGVVLADLADLGFDAEWATVSAADVGAPHRRRRVFIVARPSDCPPDAALVARRVGVGAAPADGVKLLPTPRTSDTNGGGAHGTGGLDLRTAVQLLPTPTVADSRGSRNATAGRTAIKDTTSLGWTLSDVAHADRWGEYGPAVARWEAVSGRTAPDATEPGKNGQPRLAPEFVEWLMGLPAGWVTEHVPRSGALKCLGNGVVWQQAAYAYTELLSAMGAITAEPIEVPA